MGPYCPCTHPIRRAGLFGTQHQDVLAVQARNGCADVLHCTCNHVVPTPGRAALNPFEPADVQSVFRPGEGDVEQSTGLLLPAIPCGLSGFLCCFAFAVTASGPERKSRTTRAVTNPLDSVGLTRDPTSVGKKYDGRLKPFGTVNRQYPHFITAKLQITLNLGLAGCHPLQEPLE